MNGSRGHLSSCVWLGTSGTQGARGNAFVQMTICRGCDLTLTGVNMAGREASRTTTTTLLTDVAAEGVTFHWGTASAWRAPDNGTGVRALYSLNTAATPPCSAARISCALRPVQPLSALICQPGTRRSTSCKNLSFQN